MFQPEERLVQEREKALEIAKALENQEKDLKRLNSMESDAPDDSDVSSFISGDLNGQAEIDKEDLSEEVDASIKEENKKETEVQDPREEKKVYNAEEIVTQSKDESTEATTNITKSTEKEIIKEEIANEEGNVNKGEVNNKVESEVKDNVVNVGSEDKTTDRETSEVNNNAIAVNEDSRELNNTQTDNMELDESAIVKKASDKEELPEIDKSLELENSEEQLTWIKEEEVKISRPMPTQLEVIEETRTLEDKSEYIEETKDYESKSLTGSEEDAVENKRVSLVMSMPRESTSGRLSINVFKKMYEESVALSIPEELDPFENINKSGKIYSSYYYRAG